MNLSPSFPVMAQHPTQDIEARLKQVRARIRKMQRLRGLMWFAAALLLGLLLAMAVDLVFAPVPPGVRWAIFVGWMAVLLWTLKKGFGPVFRRLSLVRIARWLEQRHPEMDERLSTSLELAGNQAVSPELMDALLEAADRDVGQVDPDTEVAPGRSHEMAACGHRLCGGHSGGTGDPSCRDGPAPPEGGRPLFGCRQCRGGGL